MAKAPRAYPTRFTVKALPDGKCWARSCMSPGEDKGTFVQGRGYTSYHDKPRPICTQNHWRGCPYPIPDPDPENARCCFRPDYKLRGKAPVGFKECSTCGEHVPTGYVKALNALPTLPGVPCRHEIGSPTGLGWFMCDACRGVWEQRPQPFDVSQHSFEAYLDELGRRLKGTSKE